MCRILMWCDVIGVAGRTFGRLIACLRIPGPYMIIPENYHC